MSRIIGVIGSARQRLGCGDGLKPILLLPNPATQYARPKDLLGARRPMPSFVLLIPTGPGRITVLPTGRDLVARLQTGLLLRPWSLAWTAQHRTAHLPDALF
jgi:hypothetical protein